MEFEIISQAIEASPEWAIGGLVVLLIAFQGFNYLKSREAVKLSRPTGNGFAKHVKDELDEIKKMLNEKEPPHENR